RVPGGVPDGWSGPPHRRRDDRPEADDPERRGAHRPDMHRGTPLTDHHSSGGTAMLTLDPTPVRPGAPRPAPVPAGLRPAPPHAPVSPATAARAVDATKVYGKGDAEVRALDGVTVSFERARFTAIMGPSGSGKS